MTALPPGVEPGGRVASWHPAAPAYVLCDVDGTLLGPEPEPSDTVLAAVHRATRAGLRIGIATGRMRLSTLRLLELLAIRGPHVLHNGAEVHDGEQILSAFALEAGQVDGLLAAASGIEQASLEIYTEHGYHVSSWDERAEAHWGLLEREPIGVIEAAAQLDGATVPKATFTLYDPAARDQVIAVIESVGLLPGLAMSPRTPELLYINATHPEADKGRSMARAAGYLGVAMDDTVAIGDADNDLSMLAVAGTAIAMGQAPAHVRAAAHLVVPDVDADGAAVALDACVAWHSSR